MTKHCTKCGCELHTLPAYTTSDNWQCVNCFERGVTRCHEPLREKNVVFLVSAHSTHDENYVELTNKRRYEA